MSRRILRTFGAVFLLSWLVLAAAAAATYFLGQTMLESMVGLIGAIVFLAVS